MINAFGEVLDAFHRGALPCLQGRLGRNQDRIELISADQPVSSLAVLQKEHFADLASGRPKTESVKLRDLRINPSPLIL
jgi:hypothetical protein